MLHVDRRKLVRALLACVAVLTAASVVVQLARYSLDHGTLFGFQSFFDMRDEANLPTWFSGALMLACAAAFALLHAAEEDRGWAVLAWVLVAASIDEVATVHERISHELIDETPELYVIPGALLLLAIGVSLRGFFARLPGSTRRGLLRGIGVWAFGAIALEFAELAASQGNSGLNLGVSLINTSQDLFEMLGLVIVLDATARYAHEQGRRVTVEAG